MLLLLTVALMAYSAISGVGGLVREPVPHPKPALPPTALGVDASWPTCKHPAEPAAPVFAIVGLNNGTPGTRNPCLTAQLRWADGAVGGSAQPATAFYVMAADPFRKWERRYAKPVWPHSSTVHGVHVVVPSAYGSACRGGHTSTACAYLFGWTAGYRSAHLGGVTDAAAHRYWIDVEALRDWSHDTRFNQAVIEGMAAYLGGSTTDGALGATVGLYSNRMFWSAIVGDLRTDSPLVGLDEWLPIGPSSRARAAATLASATPFHDGGRVRLVQYVAGGIDMDVAPLGATRTIVARSVGAPG